MLAWFLSAFLLISVFVIVHFLFSSSSSVPYRDAHLTPEEQEERWAEFVDYSGWGGPGERHGPPPSKEQR